MSAQKDETALQMFLAAIPTTRIRDRLEYRSVTQVEAAVRRALEVREKRQRKVSLTAIEIERIDTMYQHAWTKAVQGDLKAIDTCLKLSAQRVALLDEAGPAQMEIAYNETISQLELGSKFASIVESGRAVAKQIDHALQHGTPYDRTKALYLVPHLVNVLRELNATPAAIDEVVKKQAASEVPTMSKLDAMREAVQLRAVR